MPSKPNIKIGTSGFSFKDWKGEVYPEKIQPKDMLEYYQQELGFDCVEINSTYYTLVSEKSFEGMENKTGKGFEFVVKGYKGFTHDPFDDRLGEKKPDLKHAREDIKKFLFSLGPLLKTDKLGAVLLQFPVFFYPDERSKEYILDCKKSFEDIPLVIEFRNKGWAKQETFDFLKENDLPYCVVDEPRLPRLMPFMNEVTSDIAYLRLHGRNPNWFNVPAHERYNYLYSDKELQGFIPEISKMTKKAGKLYVFFNNCFSGNAVKNASKLKNMLFDE